MEDTGYYQPLEDYLLVVKDEGFELVYHEDFTRKNSDQIFGADKIEYKESFYVFFHPEGILLVFDTWNGGKSVNSSDFYYNVKRKKGASFSMKPTSSGSFINDDVWGGYHDGRDKLRYNIARLREWGEFLNPWIKSPRFWLSPYGDIPEDVSPFAEHFKERVKIKDTKTLERFAKLPAYVQDCCRGQNDE